MRSASSQPSASRSLAGLLSLDVPSLVFLVARVNLVDGVNLLLLVVLFAGKSFNRHACSMRTLTSPAWQSFSMRIAGKGFWNGFFTPRSFPTKRNRMTDPMDAESSRSQGPESETSDVKLQVLTEEMQLVRCELDKLSQSLESLKTQTMKVDNPISLEASLLSQQQKLVELEAQQQTSIQEAVAGATTAALEDMKNMLSAIEKKTTALIQEAVAHATAAAVNHVESMLSAAEAKQQASVQEAVAHATAVAVKDVETTLSAAEAKQQASIQEAVAHATAVVVKDIETNSSAILLELGL